MTTRESRPGVGTGAAESRFAGDTPSIRERTDNLTATQWAAHKYASRGWAVIPLNGKLPRTPNGFKGASSDPMVIDDWWGRWPSSNVGLVVPVNMLVIDVDPRNGGSDSLHTLTNRYGPLPKTLTAVTGRGDGGTHFWFMHPGGNVSGRRLGDGIDLKAGGKGYVVAAPSIHPDTGKAYAWANRSRIAPPPVWLVKMLRPLALVPPAHVTAPVGDDGRGDRLVRFVADLQPGNRNDGLFYAAARAAEYGILDQIDGALQAAAVGVGLDPAEVARVLRNARGLR